MVTLSACKSNQVENTVETVELSDTTTTPKVDSTSIIRNPNDSIANVMQKTTIEFKEKKIKKGKVKQGTVVTYKYEFTNTGELPLRIINARGSCGCTVPSWPQTEIAPGETGTLEAQFNTKGMKGTQTKTITVTSNTDPINTILELEADITLDPKLVVTEEIPSLEVKPKSN